MDLSLTHIIYFTDNMDGMTVFYRDVLGLALVKDDGDWREFDAGACRIALHAGAKSKPNGQTPKIAFRVADVPAVRDALIAKGVPMGKLWVAPDVTFCQGSDPDGNAFNISTR
ncbi:VOC family protein [Asticcacaulis sp. YBE204]|uniref:VOC family protein n=1 Tax=Asticcacaulis sp. YBE204 TaxID=1282363 RepID=UPI0003C3B855|nr:VOC family protein [Asticcacaulis sp. YBE204]ESQ78182.1 hypothetical protein AEYBE204_15205 [Asticcacaulis sp. YBE204]